MDRRTFLSRTAAVGGLAMMGQIDATSDVEVPAVPVIAAGRFHHEATVWQGGILYQTEDRNIGAQGGSCFYRYIPDRQVGRSGNLAETTGPL